MVIRTKLMETMMQAMMGQLEPRPYAGVKLLCALGGDRIEIGERALYQAEDGDCITD
ncbi:hypothetical protein [Mesorhizobium sp.]|uniref:hypothetical protein n=1 Tax=Mesorhizobium sp. TaxID=1871066 RepID=UPI0025804CC3|nr:hypothetical protein [Mesorhizobium sp.]